MKNVIHPSAIISTDKINIIRENSLAAEKLGALTSSQLDLIYQNNWFKLLVPKCLGGEETPLLKAMQLIEAAAWADGSFGWVLFLAAGANTFGTYLSFDLAKGILNADKGCLSGSVVLTNNAEQVTGGYVINGVWRSVTGTAHATCFCISCLVTINGKAVLDKAGLPSILFFIIPIQDVILKQTWKGYGLKATSTHDIEIKEVFVKSEFAFDAKCQPEALRASVIGLPHGQIATIGCSLLVSGMSLHFIDLFRQIINNKFSKPGYERILLAVNKMFTRLSVKIQKDRKILYTIVEEIGVTHKNQLQLTEKDYTKVDLAALNLSTTARKLVEELYPWGGMSVIDHDAEINRVWRDLHTASQHITLSPLQRMRIENLT
jgi:alkylation response protein AidB-like acyl-CoA dehydrogenase